MKMNLKYIIILILASLVCTSATAAGVDQVMESTLSKFKSAKGITATYTIIGRNISKQSGTIKIESNKFVLSHPMISTWFDGKTQWNYNSDTNEVTITNPSSSELQLINPYELVVNYKSNYKSTLTNSKIKGTYCILLTRKSNKNAAKKIYLYIKSSDYTPVRLDVISDDNSTSTIVISNYKSGQKFNSAEFIFPKDKFKSADIIDLR